MLKSLRLRNFKSFVDAQADFGPLTLLVGANASGKSNVLDAVRLTQGLGDPGLSLDKVLQSKQGFWPGIRGGIHEAARSGTNAFSIESSWALSEGLQLDYSFECAMTPYPYIAQEMLQSDGEATPLFETKAISDTADAEPKTQLSILRRGHLAVEDELPARYSLLYYVNSNTPIGEPAQEFSGKLLHEIQSIQFLDMVPSAMRDYVPQQMRDIGENGENLSAILWRLCQDAERKQELVDWLSELCAPDLSDIEFSTTDEGDVMLRLIEKDGSRVSARSLSDGTLRFLGELVALRTAPEGSIILMEELGNGLHPQRAHLLVEYLEAITEERKIQVIATTHSPLVLEALSPQTRGDTIVLGRRPDQPGTLMRRVADLPSFDEVVKRRGMAYLFTTDWLGQAL